MASTLPEILTFLDQCGFPFELWDCDPALADTAQFCEAYQVPLDHSANAILMRSKSGEQKYALCVLLATHRLNGNHCVRKKLGTRKVSFASAEETRHLTGMEIGGVTPIAIPQTLPIWIDEAVMDREYVILGGGNRESKIKLPPKALLSQINVEIVSDLASKG
ncbi:MAG: prolyl-tRNA editing enzyme YbaK/EbsC (Cys-tRNA(Pro) deacylase) [Gammaproteobacteria bacterium]|jgi:prolyl-tRNA editing enzyme YbaK/EbsC (Cys-tRNA(Pro) deacylase)